MYQCDHCGKIDEQPVGTSPPFFCRRCGRRVSINQNTAEGDTADPRPNESKLDETNSTDSPVASGSSSDPQEQVPVNASSGPPPLRKPFDYSALLQKITQIAIVAGSVTVLMLIVFITISEMYDADSDKLPDKQTEVSQVPLVITKPAADTVAQDGQDGGELDKGEKSVLDGPSIFSKVAPSVVIIQKMAGGKVLGFGSGFVLQGIGFVVTNHHVVEGSRHLVLQTHDGRQARASSIFAANPESDIALITIPSKLKDVPGIPICEEKARVGEDVYAIGTPQGLAFTFSNGIITQIRNDFLLKGEVIQHNVDISGGSSGGPLLNRYGEVIGINTLGSKSKDVQNLNFAISAGEIKKLVPQQSTNNPPDK